jgi:hypothetical protein
MLIFLYTLNWTMHACPVISNYLKLLSLGWRQTYWCLVYFPDFTAVCDVAVAIQWLYSYIDSIRNLFVIMSSSDNIIYIFRYLLLIYWFNLFQISFFETSISCVFVTSSINVETNIQFMYNFMGKYDTILNYVNPSTY